MSEVTNQTPEGWGSDHRWMSRRVGAMALRVSTCGSVWDWEVDRPVGFRVFSVYGQAPTLDQAVAEAEHMASLWQPAPDRGVEWVAIADGIGSEFHGAMLGLAAHVFETITKERGWVWFVWRGQARVASGYCRTVEMAKRLADLVIREELA